MDELAKIKELLNDDLFPDSKDWAESDIIGRVEWLLTMHQSIGEEIDALYDMLNEK